MPVCTFFLVFFLPFFGVGAVVAAAPAGAGVVAGFCSSAMFGQVLLRRRGHPVLLVSPSGHHALGGGAATERRTIPRLGPLRVRALVCVRWPRTGSPLRWR